jgi:FAD:protein FMN transferase
MTLALACVLASAGCAVTRPARETLLSGETMGSTWTVKLAGPLPLPAHAVRDGIQARFDAVNLALSTYRRDSALSRFNADDAGAWRPVDPELWEVTAYALSLAGISDGAYDVTVGPLVDLWGFGPDPATNRVPHASAVREAKSRVGWRRVEIDPAAHRARKDPGVRIDLSSLGKGRGVDRVAEYLDSLGLRHYLIDLSGKLRARGSNAAGAPWRIAIERPAADIAPGAPGMPPVVVELRDESIATAGDYRRFFESGGRHYSHIIDPRTGEPVTHRTVSSTVRARTCMEADALATVFMVMAPDRALSLAQRLGAAALLIGRADTGFMVQPSSAWEAIGSL